MPSLSDSINACQFHIDTKNLPLIAPPSINVTIMSADTTFMDETITLSLPLGWLGELAFPLIKQDMDAMFAYRHQATQTYFYKDVV